MSGATQTITLYERVDDLETVRAWIDEHADELLANGGELPPALAELLDQATGALEAKVARVALYLRELLATRAAVQLEATRLAQREKTLGNAAEGLKRYLHGQLERAGVTKVQHDLVTVRLQKNGTPSILACPAVEALPAAFVRQPAPPPPEVDRAALVAAWKAGAAVPEGVVIAVGTHLRVS